MAVIEIETWHNALRLGPLNPHWFQTFCKHAVTVKWGCVIVVLTATMWCKFLPFPVNVSYYQSVCITNNQFMSLYVTYITTIHWTALGHIGKASTICQLYLTSQIHLGSNFQCGLLSMLVMNWPVPFLPHGNNTAFKSFD